MPPTAFSTSVEATPVPPPRANCAAGVALASRTMSRTRPTPAAVSLLDCSTAVRSAAARSAMAETVDALSTWVADLVPASRSAMSCATVALSAALACPSCVRRAASSMTAWRAAPCRAVAMATLCSSPMSRRDCVARPASSKRDETPGVTSSRARRAGP